MVCRVGHDHKWKCPNIPETVEIPTPKPYVFLGVFCECLGTTDGI
jgi:hypothetical protein